MSHCNRVSAHSEQSTKGWGLHTQSAHGLKVMVHFRVVAVQERVLILLPGDLKNKGNKNKKNTWNKIIVTNNNNLNAHKKYTYQKVFFSIILIKFINLIQCIQFRLGNTDVCLKLDLSSDPRTENKQVQQIFHSLQSTDHPARTKLVCNNAGLVVSP